MRRTFEQTHYCADASCEGFTGFEVTWNPEVWDPNWGGHPAEPQSDVCPHCKSGMLDGPVAFEDAIAGMLDELRDGGAIGETNLHEVDERAMLAAIQKELARQWGERYRAKYGPCPRCRGVGQVVISSHSVGGGCVNDQWDVCPACNGTPTTQHLSPATSKEAA